MKPLFSNIEMVSIMKVQIWLIISSVILWSSCSSTFKVEPTSWKMFLAGQPLGSATYNGKNVF